MGDNAPRAAESVVWSVRHSVVFAGTTVVLALLPWTVRHWPSQDGQNHLAVAYVLMHYRDPGSPFPQYVDVETVLRPSSGLYAALCVLGRFVSLQTAEKALVSLAIALPPASLLLLVRRTIPRRTVNVLLVLPFASGWALAMGFLGFQLSMGFGILTLALCWDPSEPGRLTSRHVLAAVAYVVCAYLHPVVALMTGLALLVLEGRSLRRPAHWFGVLVMTGPAALFMAGSYLSAGPAPEGSAVTETFFAGPRELLRGLFEYQVAYSPLELIPRGVALVLLVWFAYRGIRRHPPLGSTAEGAVGRVVLVFLLLYCVTPVAFRGWFYASPRFLLFALILLPLVGEIPPRVARPLLVLAPVLTCAVLAVQWPDLWRTSRQMQDILDVGASIPRGSRLIPMDFAARPFGPQPLGHAWAQLVFDREVVASQLFAAGKPRMGGERFRTLTFRPGVLDAASGKLPWSTYETWYEVVRECRDHPVPPPPAPFPRPFGRLFGGCAGLLAGRRAALDAVIDRYDYVLMLDPPDYGRALLEEHLELRSRVGSAWLFAVVH